MLRFGYPASCAGSTLYIVNMGETKLIAVWGTLREGECNHLRFLRHATFVGNDLLAGLNDKHTSVRILRDEKGLAKVELYEVPLDAYTVIDYMEERYDYKGILTTLESGLTAMVWYHKNQLS